MYVFLFLLSIILYFFNGDNHRLKSFWFLAFVLILVCGFRGEFVGRDTETYHYIYDVIASGGNLFFKEIGYILFLKFIVGIGGTQQLVFLIFSACTICFFSKFILRHSKQPYLSLLIFIFVGPFYLSTFNQIRQYLAVSIFLCYLLPLIKERNLIKFLVIVVLTSFFVHISTIVLIPFYFILSKKISTVNKIIFIVAFNFFIGIIISLILRTPYAYFIKDRAEIDTDLTLFLLQIILSFFILFFEKKFTDGEKDTLIFFNMSYFSLFLLTSIFINANLPKEIFFRMNNFFFPFIIVLLPSILSRFNNKVRGGLTGILVLVLSLYFIRVSILLGESYNLVPYDYNLKLFAF